ncbi:MAG: hypothetical protein ACLQIB_00145 [Isosphaeraceae bacterium]
MTFDRDYLALHASGVPHAGIVWCRATKYTIGQLIGLLFLLQQVTRRVAQLLRPTRRDRNVTPPQPAPAC